MKFTTVPEAWFDQLRGASNATFRLAIVLLRLDYAHCGRAFRLTNPVLKSSGVARRSKWRGLEELQRLGLVSVAGRRSKSSPTVKICHASKYGFKEARKSGSKRVRKQEREVEKI